ncbi:MAG: phosphopeptide-binding protein [Saprospiraceae bacterium]|nr:phosphopeptide-binding protein [Saprospiraceae bacterium]
MMNSRVISYMVFAFLLVASCKSDQKADSGTDAVAGDEPPKKYKITPFSPSKTFRDATLTNMTYTNGTFNFDVGGSSYKLGEQTSDAPQKMCANSAKGQHIHLIVNNQPYVAQYVSNFEHNVPDGEHNILAFLSRSYHESIKTEQAHIAKRVTVSGGNFTATSDITEPALFYSRPKGTYVGDDTKKVMLDFYVLNADLDEDYKIKLQVNGEVTLLDEWQPYYIEGLPMGQNSIGLALVYNDGSPLPSAQTSTLQTITLVADNEPTN